MRVFIQSSAYPHRSAATCAPRGLVASLVHVASLFLVIGIVGCSNPHNQPLPQDFKAAPTDTKFQEVVQKLPQDERDLLAQYLVRNALAEAFGAKNQNGAKTIGDAITAQRKFIEDEKAKADAAKALAAKVEAERAVAKKVMDEALTTAVVRKGFVPADYMGGRIHDLVTINVAFENKSSKDIKGVKGSLAFTDMFGDPIRSINLSVDDEILAAKTFVWEGSLEYNQFISAHQKLRSTPLDKMKVTWTPEVILFKDGSSLKIPAGGSGAD